MARSQFVDTLMYVDGVSGDLKPANNARVSVYAPGTTTLQTIYTTRSAGTTKANPFTTGTDGAAEFWAEWGDYDVKLEDLTVPARFGTKTIGWQSTSGADLAIPTAKLADSAVTSGKILNDAVTSAKILDTAVGTAELANDAVTAAKLAAGGKLVGAGVFRPLTLTANTNDFLLAADLSLTHAGSATAVFVVGGHLDGAVNPGTAFRVELDGVLVSSHSGNALANRGFTAGGMHSAGALSGGHTWNVRAEVGNNPVTLNITGGLLLVFESY